MMNKEEKNLNSLPSKRKYYSELSREQKDKINKRRREKYASLSKEKKHELSLQRSAQRKQAQEHKDRTLCLKEGSKSNYRFKIQPSHLQNQKRIIIRELSQRNPQPGVNSFTQTSNVKDKTQVSSFVIFEKGSTSQQTNIINLFNEDSFTISGCKDQSKETGGRAEQIAMRIMVVMFIASKGGGVDALGC